MNFHRISVASLLALSLLLSTSKLWAAPEPAEKSSPEAKSPSCDPSEADCAPCKEKKPKATDAAPCCDPELSDECIDMSPKIIGVPVPIYNPQLEFALGVLAMATFHPFKDDKVSPPWSTMAFGMYSTNKSWLGAVVQDAYWDRDNNRARLILATGKFNSEFYGTGDWTDAGFAFPLGSAVFIAKPRYLRRVWNRLYLGAQYQLLWNEAVLSPPDQGEGDETPPVFEAIENTAVYSGLGAVAEFDSRDSRFSPTEGWYAPVDSMFNMEAIGSESSFANVTVAVNYYHSWLDKRLTLASRGFMNVATSNTPPHMKPAIGMGPDLRGYAYGRYRDNLLMTAQAEARWYFWWKLGAVAWGGIGTTTDSFGALNEGTVLPSYGAGLRFLAFEEQRLVIRVDYGRGNEEGQFYFSVSEAY